MTPVEAAAADVPGDQGEPVFEAARAAALDKLSHLVGRVKACAALGLSRATWYRHHRKSPPPVRPARERSEKQAADGFILIDVYTQFPGSLQ